MTETESRGVKKGSIRGTYIKYTDEEIIDVLKMYDTITDLRASDDVNFYFLAKRRGLGDYLPVKRTRLGNIVGSAREQKESRRLERERIKQEKLEARAEKKKPKERGAYKLKTEDTTIASRLYKAIEIDGEPICGRCLEKSLNESRAIANKSLCISCYNKYLYLRGQGQDSNPHNVRDGYCNIKIQHHEKVFYIGIKTEDKVQDYLTRIGYGFIFKD